MRREKVLTDMFNQVKSRLLISAAEIQETIALFKKNENVARIRTALVVGMTCLAATFDVLDDVSAPILLLDECSQVACSRSMRIFGGN